MDPPTQPNVPPILAGQMFYVSDTGKTDKGRSYMKLRSLVPVGVQEVVVVVISQRAADFEYSYSIRYSGTDAVQLFHGKHGDPDKDKPGPLLGIPE